MKTFLLSTAAAAAALTLPAAASAQAVPPALVAIVDVPRILTTCTACVSAQAQLQAQQTAYQQRGQQLSGPIQAEQQAIQTALNAVPAGQQPDAALRARITNWQNRASAAQRELDQSQATLQRNQQYVIYQIQQQLNPVVQQVMQQRGANVAVDVQVTMAHAANVDITDSVLAMLNQRLTTVSVTAPPPQAAPGTAPAIPTPTPTPTTPRPRGR